MSDEILIDWTVEGVRQRFERLRIVSETSGEQKGFLVSEPFCNISGQSVHGAWALRVHLSIPFLRAVQKNRKKVMPFLGKALLNLRFGYEPEVANSPGGRDGIFHVNHDFCPKNAMVRKLYDRFLETDRGQEILKVYFRDLRDIQGVRVVSHGMRLLGFVKRRPEPQRAFLLVLVDVDINAR